MKKRFLLLSLIATIPFVGYSQEDIKQDPSTVAVKISHNGTVVNDNDQVVKTTVKNDRQTPSTRRWTPYSFVKIGNTFYDLQTNASISNRVNLHSDGTISAVFTTAANNQFTDRGTGYNYYNGSSWMSVDGQTTRTESSRTGWPSIGLLSNGKEITMGHSAANGGWVLSTNSAKGMSDWSGNTVLEESGARPIWGRMAVSGMNVYMVSNYADSSNANEPRAPTRNGVVAPTTFSRSIDGGATWVEEHILLPGYDSTRFNSGGGDRYAITARDSHVAIITCGLLLDVTVWKSTDYGVTFTKHIADSFKYAPYSTDSLMLDTPYTSDGTCDVLIDGNGNVHAWWGLGRVLDTDLSDESYSFYPGTGGLVYWNEMVDTSAIIAASGQFDADGDNVFSVEPGTFAALSGGDVPANLTSVARLGNTSLLHMPSSGMGSDGTLYCTFSMPMEGVLDINNLNYRDIIVVYSEDNGATWSTPQNLTQRPLMEDEFGCIAKEVNDFVHLVFQSDLIPGTNLQNNSPNFDNHPVPENGNDIMYAAIPVELIKSGKLGTVGTIEVQNSAEVFLVSQNQPNPFTGTTTILTFLDNNSDVNVSVVNAMGQVVINNQYSNLKKGNNEFVIDGSNLPSGMYYYTVTAGKNTITKRMIIE